MPEMAVRGEVDPGHLAPFARAEAGAGRTSIRLSPNGETQGADDSNPEAVFIPAAKALNDLGIGRSDIVDVVRAGTRVAD